MFREGNNSDNNLANKGHNILRFSLWDILSLFISGDFFRTNLDYATVLLRFLFSLLNISSFFLIKKFSWKNEISFSVNYQRMK